MAWSAVCNHFLHRSQPTISIHCCQGHHCLGLSTSLHWTELFCCLNALQGGFATYIDVYCWGSSTCDGVKRTTVATHGIIAPRFKGRNPDKINEWDIAVLRTAEALPGEAFTLGQVRKPTITIATGKAEIVYSMLIRVACCCCWPAELTTANPLYLPGVEQHNRPPPPGGLFAGQDGFQC